MGRTTGCPHYGASNGRLLTKAAIHPAFRERPALRQDLPSLIALGADGRIESFFRHFDEKADVAPREVVSAARINPDSQELRSGRCPEGVPEKRLCAVPENEKSPGFPGLFNTVPAASQRLPKLSLIHAHIAAS